MPKEMTLEDIDRFKAAWVNALKRALKAGFDVRCEGLRWDAAGDVGS